MISNQLLSLRVSLACTDNSREDCQEKAAKIRAIVILRLILGLRFYLMSLYVKSGENLTLE